MSKIVKMLICILAFKKIAILKVNSLCEIYYILIKHKSFPLLMEENPQEGKHLENGDE